MKHYSIISTAIAVAVFSDISRTSVAYFPSKVPLTSGSDRFRLSGSYVPLHKSHPKSVVVKILGSVTGLESRKSFSLSAGNWWEDDLPNILGINPFEAALLFGALYKFYGPGILYEFAREAGKLFSTYAPIVRDLSLDIFNEGKDYLEEDRERELMRKGGVDVENMPRKTTNIIERFQAGMEVRRRKHIHLLSHHLLLEILHMQYLLHAVICQNYSRFSHCLLYSLETFPLLT